MPDGSLDADECIRFIEEFRELCRQRDHSTLGDQTLGQILAYAPVGDDGVWPGPPARDALNRPELEQMRVGFRTGAFNKRGMTSRAFDVRGAIKNDPSRKTTGKTPTHWRPRIRTLAQPWRSLPVTTRPMLGAKITRPGCVGSAIELYTPMLEEKGNSNLDAL